jgi:transcriptional regulator with XRE-family HTH domain
VVSRPANRAWYQVILALSKRYLPTGYNRLRANQHSRKLFLGARHPEESGATVRALRTQRWSQDVFADKTVLHRAHVGEIERGESNVTMQTLKILADAIRREDRRSPEGPLKNSAIPPHPNRHSDESVEVSKRRALCSRPDADELANRNRNFGLDKKPQGRHADRRQTCYP